jgi:hypothetical protein
MATPHTKWAILAPTRELYFSLHHDGGASKQIEYRLRFLFSALRLTVVFEADDEATAVQDKPSQRLVAIGLAIGQVNEGCLPCSLLRQMGNVIPP